MRKEFSKQGVEGIFSSRWWHLFLWMGHGRPYFTCRAKGTPCSKRKLRAQNVRLGDIHGVSARGIQHSWGRWWRHWSRERYKNIHIMNSTIPRLCHASTESGLGSPGDAMHCIIPALKSQGKPSPRSEGLVQSHRDGWQIGKELEIAKSWRSSMTLARIAGACTCIC